MLKSIIAAGLILYSSSVFGALPTPLTPDCTKTPDYIDNLTNNGYNPLFIISDRLNEDVKEEFLYNKSNKSVVLFSFNKNSKQVCLMIYGDGEEINPDINVLRDFVDDTLRKQTP